MAARPYRKHPNAMTDFEIIETLMEDGFEVDLFDDRANAQIVAAIRYGAGHGCLLWNERHVVVTAMDHRLELVAEQ